MSGTTAACWHDSIKGYSAEEEMFRINGLFSGKDLDELDRLLEKGNFSDGVISAGGAGVGIKSNLQLSAQDPKHVDLKCGWVGSKLARSVATARVVTYRTQCPPALVRRGSIRAVRR